MTKPSDYHAIRLWGQNLGSYEYYIANEQLKAVKDNAPLDAIDKDTDTGVWLCVTDLHPDHHFRLMYADWAKENTK